MLLSSRFTRALSAILLSATMLAMTRTVPAHNLNLGSTENLPIDTDVHWWNDIAVKTWNGYQYMAYWDAADVTTGNVYLVVARRNTTTNALSIIRFDSTHGDQYLIKPKDRHNYVALALSPVDGRIHISWSNHYNPTEFWSTSGEKHRYGLSSAGCLSQATFTNCTFSFLNGHTGGNNAQVRLTYPIYINDRQNNLYFFYRCGESMRGNEFLHIYNNDGTWTDRGLIIEGRPNIADVCRGGGSGGGTWDVDGGGPLAPQSARGVYLYGAAFDKNDRLHLSWGWREINIGVQHDLYYAYSDDALANIGTNWKNAAGTVIGIAGGSDPLRVADTSLAIPGALQYPNNNGGAGNFNLKVDSHNQPHWILAANDAATGAWYNQHVWRTIDGVGGAGTGTWNLQYITAANQNTGASTGFAFDGSNNIYHIGARNYFEWAPYNADPWVLAELRPDHVTWQGGEYLDVQMDSGYTALLGYADCPIGPGANENNTIRMQLKNNTAATQVALYWQTLADPTWTVSKSQTFTVTAFDSTYKTYVVPITAAGLVTGTMTNMELDPSMGETVGSVSIDYIRLTNTAGTIGKAWEFQKGVKLVGAVGLSANNWASWETNIELFPGLSDAQDDSNWRIDQQQYVDQGWLSFPVIEQGTPLVEKLSLRQIDISGDDEIIDWDFAVDTMGWSVVSQVSSFAWASDGGTGALSGTLSGNDSAIKSLDNLRVPIGSTDYIHIRLKNTTNSVTGRVWFITEASGTYNTTKSKVFTITANSGYTWYHINMSAVSGWTGQKLRQLRIDPSNDTGVSTGSFMIDRVDINDAPTTP